MADFALIHSPLVSPLTWRATAQALRARGHSAHVPDLRDRPGGGPYWQQHANSAAEQMAAAAPGAAWVLVGHSGAGALLPAIRQALGQPAAGYVFVDAGLPAPGRSRLATFDEAEQAEFRAFLEAGGRFPAWSEADLRPLVPDAALRARLVAELRPRGLDYWTEPLPVMMDWPDAPCGYVLFSPVYAGAAAAARELGWPVRELPGGHFHMLVDPEGISHELHELFF
jgi:hypothetical protein